MEELTLTFDFDFGEILAPAIIAFDVLCFEDVIIFLN